MLIWSTRGKAWGHRFLRTGGSADPLVDLETAFEGSDTDDETFNRRGSTAALRFQDPKGRRDVAGRPIFHEVVADGPEVSEVTSLRDGIDVVWPRLEREYSEVWDQEIPPQSQP